MALYLDLDTVINRSIDVIFNYSLGDHALGAISDIVVDRAQGYRRDTDCCVQATALSLFNYDIRLVILADYCRSGGGQQIHEAGLLTMARNIESDAVIRGKITTRDQLEDIGRRLI